MAFSDHLDIATFTRLAELGPGLKRDRFQSDAIIPAVTAYMTQLRAAGRLGRISGIENRKIHAATAWNGFVDNVKVDFDWTFPQTISHFVLIWAIDGHIKGQDGDAAAEIATAYARLCELMEAGNLLGTTFHPKIAAKPAIDDLRDGRNGDRCRLVVEDWQPRLEHFTRDSSTLWEPIVELPTPEVQSMEIDLPTGRLVLCDALSPRIHEAIDICLDAEIGDERWGSHSLNAEDGQVATTRALWKAAHVLDISTTNTTVSVHTADGELTVINDFDASDDVPSVEGMDRAGEFCCDRWSVILADRMHLTKLLGWSDAELDRDFKEQGERLQIQVQPGRWRVHFGHALQNPDQSVQAGTTATVWMTMEHIA